MKLRLKWPFVVLATFIFGLFCRPSNNAFPSIPKDILFAQYRLISKSGGENICCGTGIAISKRRILSALHVVEEGTEFELDLFDKEGIEIKTISVHLIATGKEMGADLALLESDEDLPFYNDLMDDFEVGEWGYVIGCAQATCPYNVYVGIFANRNGPVKCKQILSQIAVTVPCGESGGGVYNAKNHKLVGVCVRSKEGFTLFVPIKIVLKFLNETCR